MAREPELAGVVRLPVSEHQNSSRAYGKKEEREASSPRGSIRPGNEPRAHTMRRSGFGLNWISTEFAGVSRAWFRSAFEATECDRGLRPL